jgi:hypothetical protein
MNFVDGYDGSVAAFMIGMLNPHVEAVAVLDQPPGPPGDVARTLKKYVVL